MNKYCEIVQIIFVSDDTHSNFYRILWYFGKAKNVRNILSADKRSLLTTGTRSVIYDSNYGSVNR